MLEKLLTPKTRKFIFGNGILILLAASVFVIGSGGPGSIGLVLGTTEPFSIPFNTDTNKLAVGSPNPIGYSGSANAKTALGNDVAFDYSLLVNPSTSWQTFKPGGYITNTDPITGMQSITLEKNSSTANIGIYWSNTTIFTGTQYEVFDTSSPLTVYTDFNGDLPNYIKVVALGEANSTIKSGKIEFYCSDFSLTLSLVSSDSNMGNVYGAGAYSAGNDVTVTATAKKGYKFVGWYENGVLLSTSSPYSFTMPYGDTTIEGRFTYAQYNLTLSSEDETKEA